MGPRAERGQGEKASQVYQYVNPPGVGRTRGLLPCRPCHLEWPQQRTCGRLHEQAVEIILGPKGAFENGNIGSLTRRVATDRVVTALLPLRSNPKQPKEPTTPRVVELLRKAFEWQALLESGEFTTRPRSPVARALPVPG